MPNMPVMGADALGAAKAMLEQARSLLNNPERTADDFAQAQKLITEAQAKRADVETTFALDAEAKRIAAAAEAIPDPDDNKPSTGFKDAREFWTAMHKYATEGRRDNRLSVFRDSLEAAERKDMSEGTGSAGGFLVPPEFQTSVMAATGEMSIVRPRATKIRMARRTILIPTLDQTSTTSGVFHWFGGLQAYWQEEASAKTESDATFRQIQLTAHKLILYTRASDELVDDAAISLNDFFMSPLGFAGVIAAKEDYAFLRGTGAGQPLGVLNAGATVNVARAVQKSVTYDDLVNMLEAMYAPAQPVWVAHQSLLSTLLLMNGPTGNPVYLWGSARDGVPNTLLGFPIFFTEKLPPVTNTSNGDLILADFRYYLIGDRQALTVESTKFDRWVYDQTSWRGVHRVDGQPWLSAPFTYVDGTTSVSPFVRLGAKST